MKLLPLVVVVSVTGPGAAAAHELKEEIADCSCNKVCYTDEVSDLTCDGKNFSFKSSGFPDENHPLMIGITGSNQQFPSPHHYQFKINRSPKIADKPTITEPGAVGVAVNGIPIFDPSAQGPVQANGKPVSAAEAGELDICGGHAGRGDDYHYHIAPVCLIEELGKEALEDRLQPIGYAADGFPILAVGWFDQSKSIEASLDSCRGARDAKGRYFYNVEKGGDHAVLNCFSGTPKGFSRDKWAQRRDASGKEIVGIPIKLEITGFTREKHGNDMCSVMTGKLSGEQVLKSGKATRPKPLAGSLFHCNSGCYGHFVEVRGAGRGRTITFENRTSECTASLSAAQNNAFLQFSN